MLFIKTKVQYQLFRILTLSVPGHPAPFHLHQPSNELSLASILPAEENAYRFVSDGFFLVLAQMHRDWLGWYARFPRLTACVTSGFVHAATVGAFIVSFAWWFAADEAAQFSFNRGVTSIELAFIPPEDEAAPEPVVQVLPQPKSEEAQTPPLETKPTPRTRGIDVPALEIPSLTAAGKTAEEKPLLVVALPPLTRVEKTTLEQNTEVKRGELQKKRAGQEPAVASVGSEQFVEAGVQTVPPIYPDEMYRRRIGGSVLLELVIAANGSISRVSIVRSSGQPLFDAAAMNAATKWRGIPARRAGMPVETTALQEVIFNMPR
jgi:protein TonB